MAYYPGSGLCGFLCLLLIFYLWKMDEGEKLRWKRRFEQRRWNVSIEDYLAEPETPKSPFTEDEENEIRESHLVKELLPYSKVLTEEDFIRQASTGATRNDKSLSELTGITQNDDEEANHANGNNPESATYNVDEEHSQTRTTTVAARSDGVTLAERSDGKEVEKDILHSITHDSTFSLDLSEGDDTVFDESRMDLVRVPLPGQYVLQSGETPTGNCSTTPVPEAAAYDIERCDGAAEVNDEESKSGRFVPGGCSVCLGMLRVTERIVWSSNEDCRHVFHESCLLAWLNQSGQSSLNRLKAKGDFPGDVTSKEVLVQQITGMPWLCPECRQHFIQPKIFETVG